MEYFEAIREDETITFHTPYSIVAAVANWMGERVVYSYASSFNYQNFRLWEHRNRCYVYQLSQIEKLVEVDVEEANQDDVALLVENEYDFYNRLQSDLGQIEEIITAGQICCDKALSYRLGSCRHQIVMDRLESIKVLLEWMVN